MTDADLKFCRALAELEGATRFYNYPDEHGALWAYFPCGEERARPRPVPSYRTDPAEIVRMTKELFKHGYRPICHWQENGYQWHHGNHPSHSYTGFYEDATAATYLAMMEADHD